MKHYKFISGNCHTLSDEVAAIHKAKYPGEIVGQVAGIEAFRVSMSDGSHHTVFREQGESQDSVLTSENEKWKEFSKSRREPIRALSASPL